MAEKMIVYPLRIGADPQTIGNLPDLTTINKTNIVSAINEINNKFPVSIANGGTGGTTKTQARTNLEVYKKQSIYSNASGTTGTVTLSENSNNFDFLEIHYGWSTIKHAVTALPGSVVNLQLSYTTSDDNQLNVRSALININGLTITLYRNKTTTFNIGGISYSADEYISIYKVYGFKY